MDGGIEGEGQKYRTLLVNKITYGFVCRLLKLTLTNILPLVKIHK